MRCLVTVLEPASGERKDVLVDADRTVPTWRLLEALEAGEGRPEPSEEVELLWSADGRALDGRAPLGETLRDGLVLARKPPTPGRQPAGREGQARANDAAGSRPAGDGSAGSEVVELRIVGGPDAGRAWKLPPGRYLIGRAEDAEVRLEGDPQVSRRHAMIEIGPSGVEIEDMGAANGVLVEQGPIGRARLAPGATAQLGESVLSWRAGSATNAMVVGDGDGRLVFNRPPRIRSEPAAHRIVLPSAPPRPARASFSLLGALVPLAAGVAMAIGLHQPEFLLFAVLSPAVAVANHLGARRSGSRAHRLERESGEQASSAAAIQLQLALDEEATALRSASPDPAELASIASGPLSRLWERRREDDDFCRLRLGLVDRPSTVELVGGGGGPGVGGRPMLCQVPAVIDLPATGVLGIAGPRSSRQALARWLIVQAVVDHAPDDLQVAVLTVEDDPEPWSWIRWLPHARPDDGTSLVRLASAASSTERIAGALAQLVDDRLRRLEASGTRRDGRLEPLVVVVLDGAYELGSVPSVTRVLRRGPEVGVVTVALDEDERLLPEECSTTVLFEVAEPTRCSVRAPGASPVGDVLADLVSPSSSDLIARALAPVRLNRSGEEATGLSGSLRLLELAGLDPPTPVELAARWTSSSREPIALLGRTTAGPLVVDLRHDGPHGLVAGTTGSGKSELLQTMIASLSVSMPPDSISFVLVDYKGGSAFKDCARLPHTVGMVTDLDGHLTERALASLGAELRRRERLFRSAGVKDIDDYDHDQGRVASSRRLARLLIVVVDELASLVDELPGFVDGLVDLARRGRSLGIHLVLATQRPSGVVSPAIRTNTNLRISMRVTDAADSLDVVDSPLAAEIAKEAPGRGYLRVGHEQLTEFQAGRVGGRRQLGRVDEEVVVSRLSFDQLGARPPERAPSAGWDGTTDLSLLVQAAREAASQLEIGSLPSPWLEPLPDTVVLDDLDQLGQPGQPDRAEDLDRESRPGPFAIPFGLEDRPESQARAVAAFELTGSSNLLAVGDAGSGRSNLLRVLAVSSARRAAASDLHLYGIDCGNGGLSALEELPHCGAVVSRSEPERVERLLARLADEVASRQQSLARSGLSSIEDQRRAAPAGEALAYLVLLVDRFEGFVAAFEAFDGGRLVASLLQLLREGASAGLRVVLTGDRTALAGRLSSLVDTTLLLRLNDRSGYTVAGISPRQLPDSIPPGRAFLSPSGTELQVALLDPDPSGPAQMASFHAYSRAARARADTIPASRLPEPVGIVPAHVALSELLQNGGGGPVSGPLGLVVGVAGDRTGPRTVHISGRGGFLVAGPARSGRSNTLRVIARSFLQAGRPVLVLAPRASSLSSLSRVEGVDAVLTGVDLASDQAIQLVDRRMPGSAVLVDDAQLVEPSPLSDALARFARRAPDEDGALVVAGTPAELSVPLRGFLAQVRRARAGLVLSPESPSDGEPLGVRLARSFLSAGPLGRAVLVVDGDTTSLQVPLDDLPHDPL